MQVSRRAVVQAAVVVPAVAAIPQAPLSLDELRVLAMSATPDEAWDDRVGDYMRTRVFDQDSNTIRIALDLEARGFVRFYESSRLDLCEDFVRATPEGLEELRRHGVDVGREEQLQAP